MLFVLVAAVDRTAGITQIAALGVVVQPAFAALKPLNVPNYTTKYGVKDLSNLFQKACHWLAAGSTDALDELLGLHVVPERR